ncbi:MAG: histidine kinase [Omnitrophica bacterium RBG_13_46_9]|nr:MAG: histidine kinase [Omnitrophica bacterium RBG_13_46_9]
MNKKKILIIDDEAGFTKLIKLNLEKTRRYEVRTENVGSRGLASAIEFKPDLILLDILMPDIEGSSVAAQIKDEEKTKDIPIVFLTAIISKEEEHSDGGIIGGYPFVAKPVDMDDLIGCIEKNIKQK